MLALGISTTLPARLAANPFYRLIVKFSRYKAGSLESMFRAEALLLSRAWLGLAIIAALVWPNLEEIPVVAPLIRYMTAVYPFFFIWSLTRISGVELLQLVLEGHWTGEVLATPLGNRDLTTGFIEPLWLTVRRYSVISFLSLVIYSLETSVSVVVEVDGKSQLISNFPDRFWFGEAFFFSAIAWIVFIYLARLFSEARLRNGLLKGLATVAMLLAGAAIFAAYSALLIFYPSHVSDHRVLWVLTALTAGLFLLAGWCHFLLARNFRRYLLGQLGIDLLIYDDQDLHSTAWRKVEIKN